jgi:hypothetical protein
MLKDYVQRHRSCTQNKKTFYVTIVLESINTQSNLIKMGQKTNQLEIDLVSSEDGTQTGMVK